MKGRDLFSQPEGRDLFATPEKEPSLVEEVVGAGETALTIASGIPAEAVAGIAGIAQSLNPFEEEGAGARAVEAVRNAMTYQPRTEEGQENLQAVGEFAAPLTDGLESTEKTLGSIGYDLAGPVGGAVGESVPTALMELLSVGLFKGGLKAIDNIPEGTADRVSETAKQAKDTVFDYQSPTKKKIAELIESGSTDGEVAPYQLIETDSGRAKVKKDPLAVATIKQGFDEGVIQAVKQSSETDKAKMLEMVNLSQKGRNNKRFAMENRPSDIVGDSLIERFKEVSKQNRVAGSRLDTVAKDLKGKEVDYSPAVNRFGQSLQEMGITIDENLMPVFKNSDIEGVVGAEKVIRQIMARMKNTKTPDGYDVHRLKKFIDEQVTYGKNAEGLAGKTESVLKGLRHDLDGILDQAFPEYNEINTKYAETRGAMDAFQDAAGKKMNLQGVNADKAVGTLLRRLMSNAQSRVNLLDAINEIETVARKTAKFDDDLVTQVLFVDELDSVFGPVARTSMGGELKKAVDKGVDVATSNNVLETALKLGGDVADWARGINEDSAYKAIRDLLNGSSR